AQRAGLPGRALGAAGDGVRRPARRDRGAAGGRARAAGVPRVRGRVRSDPANGVERLMPNLYEPEWDAERDAEPFHWRRAYLGRQAGSKELGASLFEVPP